MKVANVEKRIRKVEGFEVRLRDSAGRRLRRDRQGLPGYRFRNAANKNLTVDAWKHRRFEKIYPGFHADVLDVQGHAVAGNTKLATLRASYRTGSLPRPAKRSKKAPPASLAQPVKQPLDVTLASLPDEQVFAIHAMGRVSTSASLPDQGQDRDGNGCDLHHLASVHH